LHQLIILFRLGDVMASVCASSTVDGGRSSLVGPSKRLNWYLLLGLH